MSITKRSFIIICFINSALLLILSITTYLLFRNSITEQLLASQTALIDANQNLSRTFTQTIDQLVYQYTSSEELGNLLAMPIGRDSLQDMRTKISINECISYHLNAQTSLLSNNFSTVLYVNPELAVSELFQPNTTIANVSRVFNGKTVENEEWYQNALENLSGQHIFVDKDYANLCFACKLQNSFYPGPYEKNGVGVLLGSLPLSSIPRILSFDPITKNSGFILLNKEDELVYQSDNLSALPGTFPFSFSNMSSENVTLNGISYICSAEELEWGLQLVFLTPYSDITNQVYDMMAPYLLFSFIFLGVSALVSLLLSKSISRPVIRLAQKIESITDTRNVDLNHFFCRGPREIKQLNSSFGSLIAHVNRLIDQVRTKEEQRRLSELRALQAQMNPHFVLNAMNAVNYMALMRGQDDIAATVDSIAHLMRYSITEPDQLVMMKTELDNIREYISIYVLRFRQDIRLNVSVDCSDEHIIIPKFTLQPLVENSIRHGISRQDKGITVYIHAYLQGGRVLIDVTDTGSGADADKLNAYLAYQDVGLKVTHGFGIRNVNERLRLRFGDGSGLKYLYGDTGHLMARITIPASEKITR